MLVELDGNFETERERALDITENMTGQYKAMLRERNDKIKSLEDTLYGNEEILGNAERKLKETIREKDKEIEEKDDLIAELNKKIDDMSQEFASMLKNTLDKMQERIELANTQWDTEVDVALLEKPE